MAVLKHTHSYSRVSKRLWRCVDPYCTHTILTEFVKGKASKCPDCGTDFVLDSEAMRRKLPRCLNCSNTGEARVHRAAQSIMSGILSQSGE